VGRHAQRRAGCSLAIDPRSLVRPGAVARRGAASVRLFGQHTDKGERRAPIRRHPQRRGRGCACLKCRLLPPIDVTYLVGSRH
jgi:hypothetical protein